MPCYREKLDMVQCTVIAALTADLPAGTTRTVYMCDDGNDPEKRAWAETLAGRGLVYVSGREKNPSERRGWLPCRVARACCGPDALQRCNFARYC